MSPESKGARMAADLRRRIVTGEYAPGDRLPGVRALAQDYGVSKATVDRALRSLVAEGFITIVHGGRSGGIYVRQSEPLDWYPATFEHRDHRGDTPGSEYDAWAATVVAVGRTPRQDVTVTVVRAPADIAKRLQLDDEWVAVRYRVRYVDDVPVQTADSYYPLWVASGTPILDAVGDVTIPGGLMAAAGHPQVRFSDEMTARMPTDEDRRRLSLPRTGIPVMVHTRTGYNADDRPVRVIVTVLPAHLNRVRWEVSA